MRRQEAARGVFGRSSAAPGCMSQKTWWCVGAFERKLGTETTAVAELDSATAFFAPCVRNRGALVRHAFPFEKHGALVRHAFPFEKHGALVRHAFPFEKHGALVRHAFPFEKHGALVRHAFPFEKHDKPLVLGCRERCREYG